MHSTLKLLTLTIFFVVLNASDNGALDIPDPLFQDGIRSNYHIPPSRRVPSGQTIDLSKDTIKTIDIRNKTITVILFHGFEDGPRSIHIKKIKDAYVRLCKNCNIMTVMWTIGVRSYDEAAKKIPKAASDYANFLNWLFDSAGVKSPCTLVGIGLGAHFVGVVGQHVKAGVSHVVGLNPSGHGFTGVNEKHRISRHSAKLVEVVHTDAVHGMVEEGLGHLDFYPNGGFKQPGCEESRDDFCSHFTAAAYYAEALSHPGAFQGVLCDSWRIFMSRRCTENTRAQIWSKPELEHTQGKYYMRTGWQPPYGLGESGTRPNKHVKIEKPGFFAGVTNFFKVNFG